MACLATLQSTVEKPKEIEEYSDDDSLDGNISFIYLSFFHFVIKFVIVIMVKYPQFFFY